MAPSACIWPIAAASTRIRNMEATLGTPLLHRERQGVQPTEAGRTLLHHARVLLQQAERMRGDLAEYADGMRGPGAADVEYQCADRIPARAAQRLPRRPSAGQHRFGGAAQRRDRRRGRRRHGRYRDRRRHGRGRRSRGLALSHRPVRARGRAEPSVGNSRRASPLPRCSTSTSSVWTGRARCSAFCPKRPRGSAAASDCASSCAASMPSAVSSNAMSGSASSRRRPPSATPRPMSIHRIELADEWAVRKLTICVRRQADLPLYARELVRHLAEPE